VLVSLFLFVTRFVSIHDAEHVVEGKRWNKQRQYILCQV